MTKAKLEYWNDKTEQWVVGHEGIDLLHPRRYVERLAAKGKIGRVTLLSSGEVFQLHSPCVFCGGLHDEPHDGGCLI